MRFLVLSVCVIFFLFSGCHPVSEKSQPTSEVEYRASSTNSEVLPPLPDSPQEKLTVKEIFLKHRMAVFKVETNSGASDDSSRGSGFIIDRQTNDDGTYTYTVMTNAHVADDSVKAIFTGEIRDELGWELITADEEQTFDEVKLVGLDPVADLALLSFKTKIADLPVCEFGESESVRTLDDVVVIGNSLGIGVIPTTGRINDPHKGDVNYPFDVMQTDAPIAGGNSGGPLFSLYGKVIGVAFREYEDMDGALVIPVSRIKKSMENMRSRSGNPHVVYGWWGLHLEPLEPKIRKKVVPHEIAEMGVEVVKVYPNSPASQAGIRAGDVLLAVNGDHGQ